MIKRLAAVACVVATAFLAGQPAAWAQPASDAAMALVEVEAQLQQLLGGALPDGTGISQLWLRAIPSS